MAYSSNFYDPLPGDPPDNQWKTPLLLAVGLHLLVLTISLMPSSLFYNRPELPEVITINLFNAEEIQPKKAEPKKRQPPKTTVQRAKRKITPQPKPQPPPPEKPVISTAQEIPPPQPTITAPEKVISLSPRQSKKKAPPPPEEPKKKSREADRLKALERIQARVNKKEEDKKIIHDLAKLRESLHVVQPEAQAAPEAETTAETSPESTEETATESDQDSAPSPGSAELMDRAAKHYYIAVSRKIHKHWVLPEMQNWDESLEAIIVLIVRSDGTIIQSYFEKKSDNQYFNQFVEKTIKDAAPLPHFPADMKKSKEEFGLRFRPSGLF